MAQLLRREYKRKDKDIALEEASQVIRDPSAARDLGGVIPGLLEKVQSTRIELRVSALQSLNEILSVIYHGHEALEPFLDDIVTSVDNCILDPQSSQEHDEALLVICNLSLNTFSAFEECATVFLNDVMPTLPDLTNEEGHRFFAAAFVVAFSVHSQELCMNALKRFITLLVNKRARSTEYTAEMIADAIHGAALMLSTFPEIVAAETLRTEIESLLDKALVSPKVPVLLAGLDLLQVVHEAIVEAESNQDEDESEISETHTINSRIFDGKYRNKLDPIPQLASTKDERAALRSACKETNDFLDGEEIETELILNAQHVNLEGKRRRVIVDAIRRVSRGHFQQQMTENSLVQSALGYELLSHQHAQRLKKKFKKEIERERITNTKEKKQAIAKKRQQKEDRVSIIGRMDN